MSFASIIKCIFSYSDQKMVNSSINKLTKAPTFSKVKIILEDVKTSCISCVLELFYDVMVQFTLYSKRSLISPMCQSHYYVT